MDFLLSELTGGDPHSVRFSLSPGPQLYKVSRLLQPQADLIPSLAPDLGIADVTTCPLFSSLPFPSLPPSLFRIPSPLLHSEIHLSVPQDCHMAPAIC